MSGMWMMYRHGPRPEDNAVTSYVEGLDKLRLQGLRYGAVSLAITTFGIVPIVVTLWGEVSFAVILLAALVVLCTYGSALIAGIFVGRYSAFRDLSRAKVKIMPIHVDEEHPHDG